MGSQKRQPQVFISFAGPDVETAIHLQTLLATRSIESFVFERDVDPGKIMWAETSDQLEAADYFVLLWSRATASRPAVAHEWSAAMNIELAKAYTFLFVIRIDDTPPPAILGARRYLDGWPDLETAADRLAEEWLTDRNGRSKPLLPPAATVEESESEVSTNNIQLVITNSDLDYDHLVPVPTDCSIRKLYSLVTASLKLPDIAWAIEDRLGLAFEYELRKDGEVLDPNATWPAQLQDNDRVQLVVFTRTVSRAPAAEQATYRSLLAPSEEDDLISAAFAHLTP